MTDNYSKLFFNKDIYDILEKDVINFFKVEREESSILEFKSGQVTLEKVYKEVSALHNSQGGLLVIGSPVPEKDDLGRESFLGDLTRSSFRSKDWLYQKIYSKISPPPINIKIHDVQCEDGGIIQILDIPKSINPPHQDLSKGVYYIRYETETKFAPHGLVEALFGKRRKPFIAIEPEYINSNHEISRETIYIFNPKIFNQTEVPILNLKYIVEFYNVSNVLKDDEYLKESKTDKQLSIIMDRDSVGMNNNSLVSGLNIPLDYLIEHNNEPFVVGVFVWGDNMNLHRIYIIISPFDNKHKIINNNEGGNLELVVEGLTDVIENGKNKELDLDGFRNLIKKFRNE